MAEAAAAAAREIETQYIREALKKTRGDRVEAAEILGMTPRAFAARIKDLRL
jgi:DNA-binding NtrC family response regulator